MAKLEKMVFFGDFLIEEMNKIGIDTRGVKRDPDINTSGTMVFVLPDGERSFIHYFGANATLDEKDVNYDFIKKARIFYVAGFSFFLHSRENQLEEYLKKVKQMGITTAFDTAWDSRGRWFEAIKFAFPYVDYFLPN